MADPFLSDVSSRYDAANEATLRWMLGRQPLGGGFLDTKMHSITGRDYGPEDGWRGPDFTYGWIQGRGLEALTEFAAFFETRQPALSAALDARAALLREALGRLVARDGHAFFCYDRDLRPVRPGTGDRPVPQERPDGIYAYSDAFAAKGLLAAALRRQEDATEPLTFLLRVVSAVEQGRFQMDERIALSEAALAAQPDDLGPRMILLGAAALLRRAGADIAYARHFIRHVLDRHLDDRTGLLRNVPGGDACNVGHGIEFVGFALEALGDGAERDLVSILGRILQASFRAGFIGPGLALTVSLDSGAVLDARCPWWSLPEAIRAAALFHARTGDPASLALWQQADAAFFGRYWRTAPPVAYQMMLDDRPIDVVPATPDLDPGYHTGLSLLAASSAARTAFASQPPSAGSLAP